MVATLTGSDPAMAKVQLTGATMGFTCVVRVDPSRF